AECSSTTKSECASDCRGTFVITSGAGGGSCTVGRSSTSTRPPDWDVTSWHIQPIPEKTPVQEAGGPLSGRYGRSIRRNTSTERIGFRPASAVYRDHCGRRGPAGIPARLPHSAPATAGRVTARGRAPDKGPARSFPWPAIGRKADDWPIAEELANL